MIISSLDYRSSTEHGSVCNIRSPTWPDSGHYLERLSLLLPVDVEVPVHREHATRAELLGSHHQGCVGEIHGRIEVIAHEDVRAFPFVTGGMQLEHATVEVTPQG